MSHINVLGKMSERSLPLMHNDFLMRIKTPASSIASFYPFEDCLCPCPLSCLVCSFPFSHPNHIFFFLVNSTHIFKSDGMKIRLVIKRRSYFEVNSTASMMNDMVFENEGLFPQQNKIC